MIPPPSCRVDSTLTFIYFTENKIGWKKGSLLILTVEIMMISRQFMEENTEQYMTTKRLDAYYLEFWITDPITPVFHCIEIKTNCAYLEYPSTTDFDVCRLHVNNGLLEHLSGNDKYFEIESPESIVFTRRILLCCSQVQLLRIASVLLATWLLRGTPQLRNKQIFMPKIEQHTEIVLLVKK